MTLDELKAYHRAILSAQFESEPDWRCAMTRLPSDGLASQSVSAVAGAVHTPASSLALRDLLLSAIRDDSMVTDPTTGETHKGLLPILWRMVKVKNLNAEDKTPFAELPHHGQQVVEHKFSALVNSFSDLHVDDANRIAAVRLRKALRDGVSGVGHFTEAVSQRVTVDYSTLEKLVTELAQAFAANREAALAEPLDMSSVAELGSLALKGGPVWFDPNVWRCNNCGTPEPAWDNEPEPCPKCGGGLVCKSTEPTVETAAVR